MVAARAQDCTFASSHAVFAPQFVKNNEVKRHEPMAFWAGKEVIEVRVFILVDSEGRVRETCVPSDKPVPLGLISASRAAARQWRFKPLEKRKPEYRAEMVRSLITYRYNPKAESNWR
jgi:hypothetical protein